MSDIIYRQDAMNAIQKRADEIDSVYSAFWEGLKIAQDIVEKVPSAEPERKWIPVTEALPQNYQQTICIDSRGKMMIGTYGEYGWIFPCYMNEPVAWMPLPEPWRGE